MTTADGFSRNVMISIAGHALVAALIMFRAVLAPSEPVIIRNAIRVDVVGLPQKMKELPSAPVAEKPAPAPAPKALPKKAEPEPAAKPKPHEISLKKADHKKSQQSALEKLKQQSAFDKLNEDTGKEKSAKPKASARVAGNQISQGSALDGVDQSKANEYAAQVADYIRSHWVLPQWLADSPYKAVVNVRIDDRGFVIHSSFKQSSGNDIFDEKVKDAINASSPIVPPPPPGLQRFYATVGIMIRFPQE